MPRELGSRSSLSFFSTVEAAEAADAVEAVDAEAPIASAASRPQPPDSPTAPEPAKPRRRRRVLAGLIVTGLLAGLVPLLLPSSALADPTANDWLRLRTCESSNDYSINTGNGHYGAYQFDLSTWRSVGGTGLPSDAAPAVQDALALRLYHERGWEPWQCASILGLPTRGGTTTTMPGSKPVVAHAVGHAYPGRSFSFGDSSPALAVWQRQMRARGATLLTGTGTYGAHTELVVKALQQQNGLPPEGLLGPKTWALAWTGKFVPSNATRGGAVRVPAFAGHNLSRGVDNAQVAAWQKQMHARGGTSVVGTGQFGPKTLALVKSLQRQNGRPATGVIDRTTWTLAWTGSFHS